MKTRDTMGLGLLLLLGLWLMSQRGKTTEAAPSLAPAPSPEPVTPPSKHTPMVEDLAVLQAQQQWEAEKAAMTAEEKAVWLPEQLTWETVWGYVPGGVEGGATAFQMAQAGIAPSTGAIGQELLLMQQIVENLPGGKLNPEFRSWVEQGLGSKDALIMMGLMVGDPAEVRRRYEL